MNFNLHLAYKLSISNISLCFIFHPVGICQTLHSKHRVNNLHYLCNNAAVCQIGRMEEIFTI